MFELIGNDHSIPGGRATVFCEKKIVQEIMEINSLFSYLLEKIICS